MGGGSLKRFLILALLCAPTYAQPHPSGGEGSTTTCSDDEVLRASGGTLACSKTQFIRFAATSSAEVANVRAVAIQAVDQEAVNAAGVFVVRITLRSTAWAEYASSAFTITDGGEGSLQAGSGTASVMAATNASGLLEIDLTDVAGASSALVWIEVNANFRSNQFPSSFTFDLATVTTFDGS